MNDKCILPPGPWGWTEPASEGRRGSQWDRCIDGVGERGQGPILQGPEVKARSSDFIKNAVEGHKKVL